MRYSQENIENHSSCRPRFNWLLVGRTFLSSLVQRITEDKNVLPTLAALALLYFVRFAAGAGPEPLKLTIAPSSEDRRYILAEHLVPSARLTAPFKLSDAATSNPIPCQWESSGDGAVVRWLVPALSRDKSASFILEHTDAEPKNLIALNENPGGWLSVQAPDREITRYYFSQLTAPHAKPFFYPLISHGVAVTRSFPMEKKAGEETDHPHHSSVYFAHGEVNGKDYWSKVPITHTKFLAQVSGPVYARIAAENAWGVDLNEFQDITILNVGQDIVMDWTITLKADNAPAVLGKTKEGGFSVRVATGLMGTVGKTKGIGKMKDSLGNEGEPAIRAQAAGWADDYGVVDGKAVGVAIMNHPTSWRHPTNWHVRDYGLFAANAFFVQGEHTLKPAEPITLKYRLFVHGGDPAEGHVQEVYAGYAATGVVEEK